MASQAEQVQNEKSYKKIARLNGVMYHKGLKSKQRIVENILENEGDINYLIPENNYFKYKQPQLIGSTILHLAVEHNDFETATTLVKYGADATIKNIKGNTALHLAIEKVYQKSKKTYQLKLELEGPFINSVLALHIQSNNSANPCNQFGLSHFHIACIINNVDAIRFFLNNGVHVNDRVNMNSPLLPGYTPLHFIAKYGNLEAMEILFNYDADMNLEDAKRINPLQVLINRNLKTCELKNMGDEYFYERLEKDIEEHEKMINFIIYQHEYVKGRDICQQHSINMMGLSYFHVACNFQSQTIVETLLEQDFNLETCVSIDSPLWPGYTALHFAACCNIDIVKLLLNKGANILSKDVKGVTPFDFCLHHFSEDVASIIRCQTDWKDILFSDGQTILSDFIDTVLQDSNFYDYVETINVNMFIPFNSPLWPGYTPLHLVVLLKQESIHALDFYEDIKKLYPELYEHRKVHDRRWHGKLDKLLVSEADVTIQDANDSTPLHCAFESAQRDMVMRMMQYHGKTINPINKDGLSHLHIASATVYQELVEILLTNGADANTQVKVNYGLTEDAEYLFNCGSTPLHMVIIMDDDEIMRLLLANGADFTIQDIHGLTPIHYLIHSDDLFKEHGEILTSLDLSQDCVSSFGLSYLHVASYMDNDDLIKKLLDNGANIEATIKLDSTKGRFSSFAKFNGCTPLHLAMKKFNTSAMEVLVSRGADPFAKLPDGSVPLYDVFKLEPRRHHLEGTTGMVYKFISTLFDFEAVQHRLEEEIDMTALHIACCVTDVDKIKEALAHGIDANACIKANSPVWPNSTPIQVLCTNRDWFPEELAEMIELLVNQGADVTLQNGNLDSPIHGMQSLCYHDVEFSQLNLAFKAQKDFNVNPTNADGLSHFHLACYDNQLAVVKRFLKQGVNVNCSTDYFMLDQGGYTPLHFASNNHLKEMVKLLLRHGANVHAQNYCGDTPLHVATSFFEFDEEIFTILLDAGADMNAKNLYGKTPFQTLLDSSNVTSQVISFFLKHGCSINLFNAISQEGYIAIGLSTDGNKNFNETALFKELMDHPSKYRLDSMGRTPIHNVVSIDMKYRSMRGEVILLDKYIKIINSLVSAKFDINYQDEKGQTALHYAVYFGNYDAVIGLLENGADVNIADEKDLPPLVYANKFKEGGGSHQRVVYEFLRHLYKLQYYGIYVSDSNEAIFAESYETDKFDCLRVGCLYEQRPLKEDEIDSYHLTAYDFLSDTGAVAAYPSMLPARRELVDRYFQQNSNLRIKYPRSAEILKLQYNKALTRVNLIACVRGPLKSLVNFEFPDICVDTILRFMGNHDLQKIISMTDVQQEPSPKRRRLD